MQKKYVLIKEDNLIIGPYTLYRIKALKNFRDVKIGDLGGYIENESNLSHEGNCWIYDNARVYGNARVHENARIYNNAEVLHYAQIVGNGSGGNSRSNAHTVDWSGNGWYKGNLYVGGTSRDNANKVLSTADIKFTADGKLSVTINGVTKTFSPD